MKINWNDGWYFSPSFQDVSHTNLVENMVKVRIPHTVAVTDFHYFTEHEYQMLAGYKKLFSAPDEWNGKTVQITFQGVAHEATVYLNGVELLTHSGGYTAFTVDLSQNLRWNEENVLVVKANSSESLNIPPFGYVVDYMTYGGMYREVVLEVKPHIHIKDVFLFSKEVLSDAPVLVAETTLSEACLGQSMKLRYEVIGPNQEWLLDETKTIQVKELNLSETFKLSKVLLWTLENPTIYDVKVTLEVLQSPSIQQEKDCYQTRFGFREGTFKADGFYLNGQPLKLRGLNRHQSYPYVGYAMPKRPQVLDVHILKHELGMNAVRTSHYPQSQHFMDACDEMGLLVFTEIPGWQHIGDEQWKQVALQQVREMVLQYRNHPSIILWGVRINESKDDDAFYIKANEIAHQLDPSRQTGGVRCIRKSHLYEDVYTFNDFSFNGSTKGIAPKRDVTPDVSKAYLVSEYNGHMFPTKSFDPEAHRTEHARRHAVVVDALYGGEGVAGGFGWCLFDYNTHKDFGSGDRICYHGVLDMFRNHKLAASVYSSQSDHRPILCASSDMAIGDFPEGGIGSVYVFSNADEIKLYKNDAYVKTFQPARGQFPHMPHPPFVLDDFIGELMEKREGFSHHVSETIKSVLMAASTYGQSKLPLKYKLRALKLMMFHGMNFTKAEQLFYDYVGNWGGAATEYRIEAIKNGQVVKSVRKKPTQSVLLAVDSDTTRLIEGDTYDVATIRIRATNEEGEGLAYFTEPVSLEVEGPLELIGPATVPMRGGMCGTYVRTTGVAGRGSLIIRCGKLVQKMDYHIEK